MSNHYCPNCGSRLTFAQNGLCPNCNSRSESRRNKDGKPERSRGLTKILWLWLTIQKPIFYFFILLGLFGAATSIFTIGHTTALLLPKFLVSPVLITMTGLSLYAVMQQHQLPTHLPWRTLNLMMVILTLPLGVPALTLLLADQHVAPHLKLIRTDSPLWGWNQLNLLMLPLYFGLMTLGSFS